MIQVAWKIYLPYTPQLQHEKNILHYRRISISVILISPTQKFLEKISLLNFTVFSKSRSAQRLNSLQHYAIFNNKR